MLGDDRKFDAGRAAASEHLRCVQADQPGLNQRLPALLGQRGFKVAWLFSGESTGEIPRHLAEGLLLLVQQRVHRCTSCGERTQRGLHLDLHR